MSTPLKYFEATCCVLGCPSSPLTGQTFHLFPPYQEKGDIPFKDEAEEITLITRREAWMMLLNLSQINIRTRVCSRHFDDSEFQKTRRPSTVHTVVNKNMLRTSSIPTLNLPKPTVSGERSYVVIEIEKNKMASSKSKRIIVGVTAYVCCVPDCCHNNITEKCKMIVIPNNLESAGTAWNEFYCKMKQHITKNSRVCSCHFFSDKHGKGPIFYPSDLIDALGLTAEEKKQFLVKIVPNNEGTWNLLSEGTFKRHSEETDESLKSQNCENYKNPLVCKVETMKNRPQFFCHTSGFKSYHLYKTFLSVFDQDYIDVLTESTQVPFEDQILLTLMKLRHNFTFHHLGKEFHISHEDARGIFDRCTAVMENALCDGVLDVGRWETHKTFWKEIPECSLVFFPIEVLFDKENIDALKESERQRGRKCKSLISVTPSGLITYVGQFFPNYTPIEEIVNRSKLHSVAEPGDIIFINETDAVQVKDLKDCQLVLTPTAFSSDSEIHNYLLKHVKKLSNSILKFNIIKYISADLSNHASRICKVVCAVNNFKSFPLKELLTFYLNSQKVESVDNSDDHDLHDFPNFINLIS